MKLNYIYRVTNTVTNKVYIGFTSTALKNRITHHKHNALVLKLTPKFYKSIRKHGWENFVWDIIYVSKDRDHCLKSMEPYFIKEYDSIKTGYNMSVGGDGGVFGRENGMFGKTHTEEVKQRISLKKKGIPGHKHTIEHRKSLIGNNNNAARRKPVYQIALDGKTVTNIFPSLRDGSITLGKNPTYLYQHMKRTDIPLDGYFYRYSDLPIEDTSELLQKRQELDKGQRYVKGIRKYDLNNTLIETYSSIRDAVKQNPNISLVYNVLLNKLKTNDPYKGYIWKFS